MARRWLLLLGSNLGTDACMRAALEQLAARGPTALLTPIQRFPSDDGSAAEYFNALVAWQVAGDHAGALRQLKRMEQALGRGSDGPMQVTIDIDLLAEQIDGHWQADPHALEKHEFDRAMVLALLQQAGVAVLQSLPGRV
jgi:7,8-dihydro-6-hydroxymethylpterin-pyrophosphokinase